MSESWRPTLPLRLLLWWISITFLTGWLPLVRGALDGPTYEWNTSYFGYGFSGAGMGGDYWLPLAKVVLALVLLTLGWRRARFPFGHLLIAWQIFGLGDAIYSAITEGEAFRFRGDTLGIDVSIAWVAPGLYFVALLLSIWWFFAQRNRVPAYPVQWTLRNTHWLLGLAVLLPIQFVLLRFGQPHGITDQIGVMLTVLQWFMLPLALRVQTTTRAGNQRVG